MDKLNSIIFIQLRFKFLFKFKKIVFGLYNEIYKHIQNLSIHTESMFQLQLISNYIYNNINNELSRIIDTYNTIKLSNFTTKNLVVLYSIKNKLKSIINKVGSKQLKDIDFYYNINFNLNNLEELKFINTYFNPTKIVLYNKKDITPEYDMTLIASPNKLLYSKIKKKIFQYLNILMVVLYI